jgi:hypothetical protein
LSFCSGAISAAFSHSLDPEATFNSPVRLLENEEFVPCIPFVIAFDRASVDRPAHEEPWLPTQQGPFLAQMLDASEAVARFARTLQKQQ